MCAQFGVKSVCVRYTPEYYDDDALKSMCGNNLNLVKNKVPLRTRMLIFAVDLSPLDLYDALEEPSLCEILPAATRAGISTASQGAIPNAIA